MTNRFQTPIENLINRMSELENLISSSTQVFALLKESDILTKLQLVDSMFELLVELPLLNLKILSIFTEFNNNFLNNSINTDFVNAKNSQLQKELLEYNSIYANFIEQTRQS